MSDHDQLTGMPNKTTFLSILEETLARAKKGNRNLGILMLDLDGYKTINERFGHQAADMLLHTMAERLRGAIRETDKAAHFGGDTFAVCLVDPNGIVAVAIAADRIRQVLNTPILIEGVECSVGVSVGVAVYPENGTELDRLITVADSAMFESKTRGKNTSTVYKGLTRERADILPWFSIQPSDKMEIPEIDEQHEKLATLINELHQALASSTKESRRQTTALYDQLIQYTEFHFATEARLMHKAAYPDTEAHIRAHKFLLDELKYLKSRIIEGEEHKAFQILRDWLINHIEKDDKPMGVYLQNKMHSS